MILMTFCNIDKYNSGYVKCPKKFLGIQNMLFSVSSMGYLLLRGMYTILELIVCPMQFMALDRYKIT